LQLAQNFDGGNPADACARAVVQASSKSYSQLRAAHIADHQALYRVWRWT